jgi:integrase
MPGKAREFSCPECDRTRVTQVVGERCLQCYERARERRSVATCEDCGRTRYAYFRRGLCPACYEQRRRRSFRCATCLETVKAPASFAAMATCPRCWSRDQVVDFVCPSCGLAMHGRPDGGTCHGCATERRMRTATCVDCGQTRRAEFTRGVLCKACRSARAARRKGIATVRAPLDHRVAEARCIETLAPLRRGWLREFLDGSYRRRSPKTRRNLLRVVAAFDRFVLDRPNVGPGQWSLVSEDDVEAYLAEAGRFSLQPGRAFFEWLGRKQATRLQRALPAAPHLVRIRQLPAEELHRRYREWTAGDADPLAALAGLLAIVHCLRSGEIRTLRLSDVVAPDLLRVRDVIVPLAPPVEAALGRYLEWRSEHYGGPSRYLLVSRASRLHDRPISQDGLQKRLGGATVAALRQTAIRQLFAGVGADGLQLAAATRLSLHAADTYRRAFGERTLVAARTTGGAVDPYPAARQAAAGSTL